MSSLMDVTPVIKMVNEHYVFKLKFYVKYLDPATMEKGFADFGAALNATGQLILNMELSVT